MQKSTEKLEILRELALDLFWSWSHAGDGMWRKIDPDLWEKTGNPWFILQQLTPDRLDRLLADKEFLSLLNHLQEERTNYLQGPAWFDTLAPKDDQPRCIAYFSMEFGLSEALPLYAGGLGILAGDYLKAASDLGIPLVGVGLLYQEGYCRQYIDTRGRQIETYPYNEPASLPIEPVRTEAGTQLRVSLELPGRLLSLRVWQAKVGRVTLYLLDSNDLMNDAPDRGITAKLYGGGEETRFLQEFVLGFGGWRALEAMGLDVEVCHLNEGHASMVVLARALSVMARTGLDFWPAFWAARAGNVFTTHTPVSAGFDRFEPKRLPAPANFIERYLARFGVTPQALLALGRERPEDDSEPFNMTWLALRGCAKINAVSAVHERVSKALFQGLYPRWPVHEVPVGHVTNGVHAPSWDSVWADRLWTETCGKMRWRELGETLPQSMDCVSDEDLWSFRSRQRADLVENARARHLHQVSTRNGGVEPTAPTMLDPNILTVGFARRFTSYKRPNLLLTDPDRLARLLTSPDRPVQLIIAGKAHPEDNEGKRLIAEWIAFTRRPDVGQHVVFLEDYDIGIAQELVAGVDLWINSPRPPMEACGTSGMKVLVNGGLNLSVLDGWWAEAYTSDVGWAVEGSGSDTRDADMLFSLLEHEAVPEFYDRAQGGLPLGWIARIRASLSRLTPAYSANRMANDYFEDYYRDATRAYRARVARKGALAHALHDWHHHLSAHWHQIHFGEVLQSSTDEAHRFEVQVYLGDIQADQIRVELYAAPTGDQPAYCVAMERGPIIPGAQHGYVYQLEAPVARTAAAYTARVVPWHEAAFVPTEASLIRWQK